MDWIHELTQNDSLCCSLTAFLDEHGFSGLEKALQLYSKAQAEYICKTKAAVTRIKMDDIYYLEIQTHTIRSIQNMPPIKNMAPWQMS